MAQNISTILTTPFTLAGGASAYVDVRLSDIEDMRIMLTQTYQQTGATTGVVVNLFPGMGGKDPAEPKFAPVPNVLSILPTVCSTVPIFSNNFQNVNASNGFVTIVQPTASQGTAQTTRTTFYLNNILITWPNWVRIAIGNLDATNPVTIQLPADL